jgi:hypothetical protein
MGKVARTSKGTVDGQTLRAVRELTEDSANLLEQVLQIPMEGWTEEELKASVETYFEIATKQRVGEQVVEKRCYERLAKRYGRSKDSWGHQDFCV